MQPINPDDQKTHSFIDLARRAQIIRSAIDTIAELGYAQASLAQIARRAGITTGLISYHFSGKDELIEQVVTTIYMAGTEFMLPQIQAQTTTSAALKTYILSNVAFITAHPKEMTALLEIMSNHRTPAGKLRYDQSTEDPILDALENFLRSGQENGAFRKFDVRVMAIAIRKAIDALPPLFATHPELEPDRYAQELATLFDLATVNKA